MSIFITVFTVLLIIRDGIVDPKNRDWVLLKLIPNLPWYWWLVIGAVALLILALEGAYDVHAKEMAGFQRRYRTRLKENKKEFTAQLASAGVQALLAEKLPKNKEVEVTNAERQLFATKDKPLPQPTQTVKEHPLVCLRAAVISTLWKGEVISKVERSEKSFDTAIAEFANSPNAQGWVYPLQYLHAQITYYDSEGIYHYRVSRSFWVGAEEYFTHLQAGDVGQLVIAVAYKDAVFAIDNPNPKDYRVPEKQPFMLDGDTFRVLVCLTEDNSASSAVNFAFSLTCRPELKIEVAELGQESEAGDG